MTEPAALEFAFRWDRAEHRRLLRAVERHRERAMVEQVARWAVLVSLAVVTTMIALVAIQRDDVARLVRWLPWLAFYLVVLGHRGPLHAWLGARRLAREAPGADVPVRFRVGPDGVEARWGRVAWTARWDEVRRVVETEDGFLFFDSPRTALVLPARAAEDDAGREALRQQVRRGVGGAAELRGGGRPGARNVKGRKGVAGPDGPQP